jgi:hypothetical protein
MLRVIIRVRREGESEVFDLEAPAEVPAEQLSDMLARARGWERTKTGQLTGYTLVKGGVGQVLRGQETLADAGIWEGAEVILRPKSGPPERVLQPATLVSAGGRQYPLPYPKMRVGRSAANDADNEARLDLVDLRDEPEGRTVSRNHALVVYTNGDWSVIPFDKTENQTLVNDQPVDVNRPYQLISGDRLRVGGVVLEFRLSDAA